MQKRGVILGTETDGFGALTAILSNSKKSSYMKDCNSAGVIDFSLKNPCYVRSCRSTDSV